MAEYVYNGKGERVIKELTDPILYYYDQNGQLLAELDENGDTIREYAWLDGQPLAMMIEDVIYNYHDDHLGTPQFMTDDFQGIVWEANYEPFGKANITTSTVTNNLRFPGQYFDDETDLHYNYFRDYDANTGRYVQSDPIGLGGGLNTYSYSLQNPVNYFDLSGEDAETAIYIVPAIPIGIEAAAVAAKLCPTNPLSCIAAAGAVGYGVGSWAYPYVEEPIANAVDMICGVYENRKGERSWKKGRGDDPLWGKSSEELKKIEKNDPDPKVRERAKKIRKQKQKSGT